MLKINLNDTMNFPQMSKSWTDKPDIQINPYQQIEDQALINLCVNDLFHTKVHMKV